MENANLVATRLAWPLVGAETVIVVSDLHIAAGRLDPFSEDAALVAFLTHVAARAHDGPPVRFVLLGDSFDFTLVEIDGRRIDQTIEGALARLDRIAGAHRDVLDALGRVVRAGAELHVVPGNHDLELLFPPVMAHLRELLGSGEGVVLMHPWALHLPGLAYLEHGQQHHDLNRLPGLLDRADNSALPPLAGTAYGECLLAIAGAVGAELPIERTSVRTIGAALGRRPWLLPRAVAPTLRAARNLGASQRAARRGRVRPPGFTAGAAAQQNGVGGLSPAVMADLERVSASTPARAVRRLLTSRTSEPYMVRAAREVHRSLAAAGRSVPFYVFAHTHEADDRPLDTDPAGPRYLNAGTWSRLSREGARRRCYVELTITDGRSVGRLNSWEPDNMGEGSVWPGA